MKHHWPEYFIEAAGLGLFMLSASVFGVLLFHPASPAVLAVSSEFFRRVGMGTAMAVTASALIYSPWGRRSGAHFNPAVTLTFLRLGKIAPRDAAAYVGAQFAGGTLGMLVASGVLKPWLAHASVNHVTTQPGKWGDGAAWFAEFIIAFLLMGVVLVISNSRRWARFTGAGAAACVLLFITFEAPLSGMSLNPARSLASAVAADDWTALWIYFTAPPLGMLAAATLHHRLAPGSVACAKLHHDNPHRCIFCEFQQAKNLGSAVRIPVETPLNPT